jgi:hypothetical protein
MGVNYSNTCDAPGVTAFEARQRLFECNCFHIDTVPHQLSFIITSFGDMEGYGHSPGQGQGQGPGHGIGYSRSSSTSQPQHTHNSLLAGSPGLHQGPNSQSKNGNHMDNGHNHRNGHDGRSEHSDNDIRSSSVVAPNFFDVSVVEHYVVGNGSSYDKHIFSICVNVEGIQYTVDRSYVDFVDLDRKLRKKFPRIKIPILPLEAGALVAKVLTKEAPKIAKKRQSVGTSLSPAPESRGSVALTRESITAFTRDGITGQLSKSLKLVEGDNDIIGDKVAVLDKYLKSLMSMHELLASDEILLFLDEEATSMSIDPNTLEPISAHDLLLLSTPTNSITVSRTEDTTFNVRPGQLVVWRFTTEKYDIGFSVEMCGDIKVSYTRYNSHIRPVSGTVEATSTGICRLIWDNTYAKCK